MRSVGRISAIAGRWFPLIVLAAGALAIAAPGLFAGWSAATPWLLSVIMLGMGLTLQPADFGYVARRPWAFVIGVVAHYVIMPGVGWILTEILPLSPQVAVGVLLVACAPSGTASNVMVFIAKGDTALSVAMASVSTLLAPLLTPYLLLFLAHRYLAVSAGSLLLDIVKVVIVPVILGFVIRLVFGRRVDAALPVLPLVSVLGITGVVVAVVSASRDNLVHIGGIIVLAVVLHNLAGLALGYLAARATGLDEGARRAIALEVGMQNSGLAATLAATHFSPVAALPAAVFSVWHNVSGSLVAGFWSRRPARSTREDAPATAVAAS